MIPQKIHYCWFSKEPYPQQVLQCMESWKKNLPGYEWIHWDECRARKIHIPWIDKALDEHRWAFASDAVRLYAIYTEGGIYLDCDVEILKSFDSLLKRSYFFGYENGSNRIEGAIFGAEKNFPAIQKALDYYRTHPFHYQEAEIDNIVLPNIMANSLQDFHLEIFSENIFSPKSFINGKIQKTSETLAIHHFSSSWRSSIQQKNIRQRQWLYRNLPKPIAKIFAAILALRTNLKLLGFRKTLCKIFKRRSAF